MGEIPGNSPLFASLEGAAQYHYDVVESLKRYFSPDSPDSLARLDMYPEPRVAVRPADYLEETGLRSSLAILTWLEAVFQLDYQYRCRKRLKDDLSRAFRAISGRKPENVSLEEDIFDAWSSCAPGARPLIGELRSAFKFRNWLAHGRYWTPRLGRNYNFESLYLLADAVYSKLPLRGVAKPEAADTHGGKRKPRPESVDGK
jgi:hypothetical protein